MSTVLTRVEQCLASTTGFGAAVALERRDVEALLDVARTVNGLARGAGTWPEVYAALDAITEDRP